MTCISIFPFDSIWGFISKVPVKSQVQITINANDVELY